MIEALEKFKRALDEFELEDYEDPQIAIENLQGLRKHIAAKFVSSGLMKEVCETVIRYGNEIRNTNIQELGIQYGAADCIFHFRKFSMGWDELNRQYNYDYILSAFIDEIRFTNLYVNMRIPERIIYAERLEHSHYLDLCAEEKYFVVPALFWVAAIEPYLRRNTEAVLNERKKALDNRLNRLSEMLRVKGWNLIGENNKWGLLELNHADKE